MLLSLRRRLAVVPTLALLALVPAGAARAQLSISIPVQSGARPLSGFTFVDVVGTVTNMAAVPLYLSGPTVSSPTGFGAFTPFWYQGPDAGHFLLAPGASATGLLFSAAIPTDAVYAMNVIPGTFGMSGGLTPLSHEMSGATTWTLNIVPASTVPEPATLATCATGLVAIGAFARRRRRR